MYGAPKGSLVDFGRITTAYVRKVGPRTFEARDPDSYFAAIGNSITEAVGELKKRLGPIGRMPRNGEFEGVVRIHPEPESL